MPGPIFFMGFGPGLGPIFLTKIGPKPGPSPARARPGPNRAGPNPGPTLGPIGPPEFSPYPKQKFSPESDFLVSKFSPISALDTASFSSLAAFGGGAALSPRLPALCSAARLLCSPSLYSSTASHPSDSPFAAYSNSNFSNYGTDHAGGANSFKKYSPSENLPIDTFRRYSRDSASHDDSFAVYQPDGNVVTANFTSYAFAATGGAGDFSSYAHEVNVPNLKFTNYDADADANGRVQTFSGYSDDTNSGDQSFAGYGKSGNGIPLITWSFNPTVPPRPP